MTALGAEHWGQGAVRAAGAGEGEPRGWASAGLRPVAGPVPAPVAGLVVALAADSWPQNVGSVVCHPCLGRSAGDPAALPVSVVWEAALGWIAAKAFGVPARIGLCVAEEALQHPARAEEFHALGDRLAPVLDDTAAALGVRCVTSVHHERPDEVLPLPDSELYGLFTPFHEGMYPLGFPNSDDVLDAFRMYCSRYADAQRKEPGALVFEGVHLSRSVLLGSGAARRYVAAAPLPDPSGWPRLAQDAPADERITIRGWERLPVDWWPEQACRDALGTGFRELAGAVAGRLFGDRGAR
ncbi:hypothetical protein ACFV4F_06495 [Kitasatospora sp. NPDC059722]|uniref:hypothetical protein n=1 Tax=unclassified Kitasatospora TaxID=2633591 RepID=UPI00366554E1